LSNVSLDRLNIVTADWQNLFQINYELSWLLSNRCDSNSNCLL